MRLALGGALLLTLLGCGMLPAVASGAEAPAAVQITPSNPAGGAAPTTGESKRSVVFNFDQADIEVVLRAASEIVGFNYVVEPEVKGKRITVDTTGRIRHQDVFRTLLAILEVHGVTAVKSQKLYKFVRLQGTPARSVPTVVGSTPDPRRPDDEVVTQVVPLERASAVELHARLRPLLSASGSLLTHRETNVLIITDTVANIRRHLEVVNLLEAQVSAAVSAEGFHVVSLRFADAQELASVLGRLYARDERPPSIVAHHFSNALIVRGTASQVEGIRRQLAALDTEVSDAQRVFVYFPEHAHATDLTAVMSAAGVAEGAARFVADERTNAVIVVTSPRRWADIERTLKGLDRDPRQIVIEVLAVEVSQMADRSLDVAWATKVGPVRAAQVPSAEVLSLAALLVEQAASVSPSPLPGLTALIVDTDRLLALLNAVAAEARISVLSSTRITVAEGKKALINVSESVPVVTAQQAPTAVGGETPALLTQSIEFRDAGTILTVTPRIGDRGTVILELKHTLDEIGPRDPTLGVLTFAKREAETSLAVPHEQTLVLGGLLETRRGVERSGVPFLSKIPVLGALFGGRSETDRKREILILVTPRIADVPAAAGAPPSEGKSR